MDDLSRLGEAVRMLRHDAAVAETISELKHNVASSREPFVWASLDLKPVAERLPTQIKSSWIFVLKKSTWSGAHAHPNSVQHMIVLEGHGRSRIGGISGELVSASTDGPTADQWYVIEAGTAHEFYPIDSDMVVMSFHTCAADELIEIASDGAVRHYEKARN